MAEPTTYIDAATSEAEAERSGMHSVAFKRWQVAQELALKQENREWAEHRADFCGVYSGQLKSKRIWEI